MTGDALVALERAGFSRRDFLKTSGALIVVFSSVPVDESLGGQGPFGTRASHIDPARLDSWIAIDARGTVTAYTGKCELGQGMQTAQMQLVAEELSIPIAKVRLVMCDTAVSPDQGTTSGSQSTPTNFNDQNLARAAASARASLLRLGAERLQLGTSQVMAVDGAIRSIDDPSPTERCWPAERSTSRWTWQLCARRRAPGRCSARPSREWTWSRWRRADSNSFTTSGCRGCCTARWFVLRRSAPRSCAWTRLRSPACPASSKWSSGKTSSASSPGSRGRRSRRQVA